MKLRLSKHAVSIGLASAIIMSSVGVSTPASAAPARSSISLSSVKPITGTTLMTGGGYSISGTTSASLRGQWLKLQVKKGSTWSSTTLAAKVSSAGRFSFKLGDAKLGSVSYRAVYWGSSAAQKAYSGLATATAYRWKKLSRMEPKSSRLLYETAVDINGSNYPNSLLLPRNNTFDGNAVYDLKRKCVRFATTAGVPDDQPITGRALANIIIDGNLTYSQVLTGGQSYRIEQDITKALELRLERDYVSGAFHDLAFGNASVLCSF